MFLISACHLWFVLCVQNLFTKMERERERFKMQGTACPSGESFIVRVGI